MLFSFEAGGVAGRGEPLAYAGWRNFQVGGTGKTSVPVRRWRNLSTGITATTPEPGISERPTSNRASSSGPTFDSSVKISIWVCSLSKSLVKKFLYSPKPLTFDSVIPPTPMRLSLASSDFTASGGTIATTYLKFMISSLFSVVRYATDQTTEGRVCHQVVRCIGTINGSPLRTARERTLP